MFSMAARYSWLQLSTPNKPCPAVRQSLVFVIMAFDWGFCYLDLDGGGILGFANWFLWDWGVVYHCGWWLLWVDCDGDFEEVLLVCGVMLHHGWLLLYWIIAVCAPINFFSRLFYQTSFFFWFCLSQKNLIIINFSKHIFVLKTSKKKGFTFK